MESNNLPDSTYDETVFPPKQWSEMVEVERNYKRKCLDKKAYEIHSTEDIGQTHHSNAYLLTGYGSAMCRLKDHLENKNRFKKK